MSLFIDNLHRRLNISLRFMAETLQPGDSILGKYKVERVLGAGGMGTVYAATDDHLGRTVAVKLLNDWFRNDPQGARMALREARAAVQLRSEHVARVFDAGLNDEGAPYIVMEFLQGQDLRQRLANTVAVDEAVGFILQACEGIAEAHAAGIVHRDLKPDNLFITHGVDGLPHVKVLDFGLAKIASSDSHHTTSGGRGEYSLFGSPPYTAPERLRNIKGVDPRSDIWSLGVVLYEALTGVRPFVGDNIPELLLSILEDSPRPIRGVRPEVPESVEAAVLRCLEKDPQARFQSVDHLVEALLPSAPEWARATGQRTLGMAGRGRQSQGSLPSATSAESGMAAISSTQRTGLARSRLRMPVFAAATLALGALVVFLVRHEQPVAPTPLAPPSVRTTPAEEPTLEAGVPSAAPDVADSLPGEGNAPRARAHSSRPRHGKAAAARRDIDPLEGRK